MCICALVSLLTCNVFYLMLVSTGYLALVALLVSSGGQYSNFTFNIFFFLLVCASCMILFSSLKLFALFFFVCVLCVDGVENVPLSHSKEYLKL